MKTLAVLNPFRRIEPHIMDDSDVAGPILFFFIFGTSLLVSTMVFSQTKGVSNVLQLSGKLHFGYIYGTSLCARILAHFLTLR